MTSAIAAVLLKKDQVASCDHIFRLKESYGCRSRFVNRFRRFVSILSSSSPPCRERKGENRLLTTIMTITMTTTTTKRRNEQCVSANASVSRTACLSPQRTSSWIVARTASLQTALSTTTTIGSMCCWTNVSAESARTTYPRMPLCATSTGAVQLDTVQLNKLQINTLQIDRKYCTRFN